MNINDYETKYLSTYEAFAETIRFILDKALLAAENLPRPQSVQCRAKGIESLRRRLAEAGTLDKFTGDGLMALYGLDAADPASGPADALRGAREMLMRVEQLMSSGDALPVVQLHTSMRDVIYEMSRKALGMTSVVEKDGRLAGIITDGDLRRKMSTTPNIQDLAARDVMTVNPVAIPHSTLAVEALALMEQRKITSIVVIDSNHRVEGVVHLHDLWRTEMF